MKKIPFAFILLFITKSYSQNKLEGLILDAQTKKPVEFVDIYNDENFTSTNAEGKFVFQSMGDSINIKLLGYAPMHSTFEKLKSDTIFLKSRFEILDEVVLSEPNSIKTVFKSIYKNYPFQPFTEAFFLRGILRKDGQIVKLQDVNGLVHRKTLFATSKNPMPKNNYTVEVENMRKTGIKDREIYFEMFSFEQFLTAISSTAISPKLFDFNQIESEDGDFIKFEFSPKKTGEIATTGYYLVSTKDNAINEFHLLNIEKKRILKKDEA